METHSDKWRLPLPVEDRVFSVNESVFKINRLGESWVEIPPLEYVAVTLTLGCAGDVRFKWPDIFQRCFIQVRAGFDNAIALVISLPLNTVAISRVENREHADASVVGFHHVYPRLTCHKQVGVEVKIVPLRIDRSITICDDFSRCLSLQCQCGSESFNIGNVDLCQSEP